MDLIFGRAYQWLLVISLVFSGYVMGHTIFTQGVSLLAILFAGLWLSNLQRGLQEIASHAKEREAAEAP